MHNLFCIIEWIGTSGSIIDSLPLLYSNIEERKKTNKLLKPIQGKVFQNVKLKGHSEPCNQM